MAMVEADYKRFNELFVQHVGYGNYFSIRDNHGLGTSKTVRSHVEIAAEFPQTKLDTMTSLQVQRWCPDVIVTPKNDPWNYRKNRKHQMWVCRRIPLDPNNNPIPIRILVDPPEEVEDTALTSSTKKQRRNHGQGASSTSSSIVQNQEESRGAHDKTPRAVADTTQGTQASNKRGRRSSAPPRLDHMTPGPDLKKRGADAARALVIGLPRGNARRVALSAFVEALSPEDQNCLRDVMPKQSPNQINDAVADCDPEMKRLRAEITMANDAHGPLVKEGFYTLRSILEEQSMMELYAPLKFKELTRDASSESEVRWIRRAKKAQGEGRSYKTRGGKELSGIEIQVEIDRLHKRAESAAASAMSIVLQSASGGGRGQHATCNTHMAVRNGLMADLGGLAESHHDYYVKQDICVGRTLCSKLKLEASNSYKETYPKLMFEMLETYKSHLRLRDNNNPQNMAKFIEQKGISRSVSTIAGLDTFFEPCYLSHDSTRPSANAQFNEVRVRNFIIRLGETPSIESALRICPVRYGNFGGDENEDPHVHDYIMTPPIPEKSSSRDGFKKFLVDKNTEDNGDQYEKHQVDPALCADPEFDLHAAAVTASSFLQVANWIVYYACWHCAMHLMKCIFGDPMNLIFYFSVLFTEHLPYRKDHWKSAANGLKIELAALKEAAELQQRCAQAADGELGTETPAPSEMAEIDIEAAETEAEDAGSRFNECTIDEFLLDALEFMNDESLDITQPVEETPTGDSNTHPQPPSHSTPTPQRSGASTGGTSESAASMPRLHPPSQPASSLQSNEPSSSASTSIPGYGWTGTGKTAKKKTCKCKGGKSGYGCRSSCPCATAYKSGKYAGFSPEGCGEPCECCCCVNKFGRHPLTGSTEHMTSTAGRKARSINFTRLDNVFRLHHTVLRHHKGMEKIEMRICNRVGIANIDDAIKKAAPGAQAFHAFLKMLLLSQDPFRSLNDGDALPFYQCMPLFCCIFEYYNLPNIANVALLNLSRMLYWTEKSETPRSYLSGVEGLTDEARKMRRGDIVATYFANCKKINEVLQEYSNAQMVGQIKTGSANDQDLFEKRACAIPANTRLARESKQGVGLDRKDGKAEVRRVIDQYKNEAKRQECMDLLDWLLKFTDRALDGEMDSWERQPIFEDGSKGLLKRGMSRLVAWIKKCARSVS